MKRAFTLVELLVVISILSMLASIIMVRISLAQATGRDSVRTQQIRQIDLATKLYIDTYKKAPLADTESGCAVQIVSPSTLDQVSGCIAVSTGGIDPEKDSNWLTLKDKLSDFIQLSTDPCSSCVSLSGYPMGYTYIAPYAMQFFCSQPGQTCTVTDESYQLYAPLERQVVLTGSDGLSENYFGYTDPSPQGGSAPTPPTDFALTLNSGWSGGQLGESFSWTASTDEGVVGYRIYSNGTLFNQTSLTTLDSTVALWAIGLDYCYVVKAYDAADNESGASNEACTGTIPHPVSTPVPISAVGSSPNVTITWSASTFPSDSIPGSMKYYIFTTSPFPPNGFIEVTQTQNTTITVPDVTPRCWRIQAFAEYPGSDANPSAYSSLKSQQICKQP